MEESLEMDDSMKWLDDYGYASIPSSCVSIGSCVNAVAYSPQFISLYFEPDSKACFARYFLVFGRHFLVIISLDDVLTL